MGRDGIAPSTNAVSERCSTTELTPRLIRSIVLVFVSITKEYIVKEWVCKSGYCNS